MWTQKVKMYFQNVFQTKMDYVSIKKKKQYMGKYVKIKDKYLIIFCRVLKYYLLTYYF